jgi:DNA-binding GntR family transcriptional regulator
MSSDPYVSKGDVIFESVREMIIRGEMLPGEPLRQRDLAARFNVSPTPVREALQRLESEGLVRSVLHQGSRVAELEDDEQEESYRILATLEPLATGLAMERMTDHDFEEVRRLERAFAERLDDESMATELNRQFHFRIYECARSPLLLSLMRVLWLSFSHRRQLWRPHAQSVKEHRLLIDALAAHDNEQAEAIIREHVLGSIGWMRTTTRRKEHEA